MNEQELYWHCLQCGANDPVEPTGDADQGEYALGDHEPCITCGDGTAHVVTLRMGACYEQGRALGMCIRDAWDRALQLRGGKCVAAVVAPAGHATASRNGSAVGCRVGVDPQRRQPRHDA